MNTSEFAKICKVEKRTLFYYDEIDLLKPATVKSNNYRDYDIAQVETMDTIKIFQNCGFSLNQIKIIMNSEDKESYIQMAMDKINSQILKLQTMQDYLMEKKRLFQQYQKQKDEIITEYQCLTYDKNEVNGNSHFFSFISDGVNQNLLISKEGELFLYQEKENGQFHREGQALVFFITTSQDQQLEPLLYEKMKNISQQEKRDYYISIIPHLFLPETTSAMKIVTFL